MAFSSVFRRVNVKELISNASVYACAAESSGAMSLVFRRWATKKTAGSTKNGRDSNPKYLGVKGTRFHPGNYVSMGKDHTLFCLKEGHVRFEHNKLTGRKWVHADLMAAHEAAIEASKPGNQMSAVYQAAVKVIERDAPELLPNLTKSAGTGIGLEFRESGLNLNAKNYRRIKQGMAVKDVAYSFNEDEEDVPVAKVESKPVDVVPTKATLRSDNQEMSKEEQRRQHQAEIAS
ncbi:hypothetical protein SETIT_1G362900v2 [Setaria italica]|uniref:FACT complex subunit n=1 Tax=Setaria italica TaxID=4555 RepID=A0A368PTC6_SETIT|nr:hypothetical protein SETIT_1G362900v2 [Setaria italica]